MQSRVAIITVFIIALGQVLITRHVPAANLVQNAATVDFASDRWVIEDKTAKQEEFLGRQSLFLSNGVAHLKDVDFEDGTIEVDIAAMPVSFPGITFRWASTDAHELVYLRPHHSLHDDATQYVPAFQGSHPWQIYSGPGYTAAAEVPTFHWFHMRIEISGLVAKVFVNAATKPTLVITDLKRGYTHGSIGVSAGAQGAHFANFSYTTAAATAHTPVPYPEPAAGTLTKWELSEAFATDKMNPETLPEVTALKWESVQSEYPGMVVIDRYRRSPNVVSPFAFDRSLRLQPAKGTMVVFARTTIDADSARIVKMKLGYSDEATVFLNGQPLFTGKSAWSFRDPDFNGVLDVENDAVYLPLKQGRNDLMLAVKEYFGGWGFMCRLETTAGLQINK
ncbi:MAG TPA: hypothetical protein VKB46_25955 [Pyrinomonadaceae bacterium]|nr:hypothetical protein [Pyrinomonadaceae bacterium]